MTENTPREATMGEAKPKRQVLPMADRMRLMDWLRVRHGDGTLAKLTIGAASSAASADLKCRVRPHHVQPVCEALGYEYRRRPAESANPDGGWRGWATRHIRDLEARLAALEAALGVTPAAELKGAA